MFPFLRKLFTNPEIPQYYESYENQHGIHFLVGREAGKVLPFQHRHNPLSVLDKITPKMIPIDSGPGLFVVTLEMQSQARADFMPFQTFLNTVTDPSLRMCIEGTTPKSIGSQQLMDGLLAMQQASTQDTYDTDAVTGVRTTKEVYVGGQLTSLVNVVLKNRGGNAFDVVSIYYGDKDVLYNLGSWIMLRRSL